MDHLSVLLSIAGIFAIGMVTPGPNFIMVTSVAMTVSRRAGVLTGLGIAGGSTTWATLSMAGLGLILTQIAWLYTGMKLLGALYLLYLGMKMILNARKPMPLAGSATAPDGTSAWSLLRRGYLTSVTNPKSAAFFGSLFVVTLPEQAPAWLYVTAVAIIALMSATWHGALALFFSTAPVQHTYRRLKSAIDIALGAAMILLGIRLLPAR